MRLWYFSSSINSSSAHAQPSSVAWRLILGWTLCLCPYYMCANSKGSGETARMHRLAWAFAGRLSDNYHNLMSWLILFLPVSHTVWCPTLQRSQWCHKLLDTLWSLMMTALWPVGASILFQCPTEMRKTHSCNNYQLYMQTKLLIPWLRNLCGHVRKCSVQVGVGRGYWSHNLPNTSRSLVLPYCFHVQLKEESCTLVHWCCKSWVLKMSQHMGFWHLSHRRLAKAQASLRIRAVSPEPLLFPQMKHGNRQRSAQSH